MTRYALLTDGHPHDERHAWSLAGAEAVFLPDPQVPARGRLALYTPASGTEDAAVTERATVRCGLPPGEAATIRVVTPAEGAPAVREVAARTFALADALPALLRVPVDDRPAYRRPPDSLRAWALAARMAICSVEARRLVPDLLRADDGSVHGVWRAWRDREQDALVGWLAAAMPPSAHALPRGAGGMWDPAALVIELLDAVADLAGRLGSPSPRHARPRDRLLPWTARWAEALADPADTEVPLRDDVEDIVAGVSGWLAAGAAPSTGGTAGLRLQAPATQDGTWLLELGLRSPSGEWITAQEVWAGQDGSLQETLLAGLGRCARVYAPIDVALREPAPTRVELDLADAWTLLDEAAPALAQTGAELILPDELAHHDLRARLRVDLPDDAGQEPAAGERPEGGQTPFGGALAGLHWEVALGGERLGEDEVDALLGTASPLVRWRGRWVRVHKDQLRAVRERSPGTSAGEVPLAEALALALAGSTPADGPVAAGEDVEVVAGSGVARLLDRLSDAADAPPSPTTPAGFVGELRPYQRRGVAWLQGMGALGLGAVLADDMGLGKGIQLIAYLLTRDTGPQLVVCPTSVVGNWQRELARFAPGLEVTRFHGPDRQRDLNDATGVVLTSYGTLRRDPEPLAGVDWDVVTLDEAQHVKNPTTAGARAVRGLRRRQTVALTGTPLENRLSELWALLDVTNAGLLGSRAAFGRRFTAPIEQRRDSRAAVRLRRLVAPFVLRREKADPAVIADLPPKIERTVVCSLTPEQARLYRAAVERVLGDGADALAGASPMERRGRVLALLTALKQVCNHPAQLLGEATPSIPGRSGKLAAAREIVAEAVEVGDRVLVFTQYVAMGHLLVAQLSADLGTDVPFLHGGMPARARDRMVASFQEDPEAAPVFVVSLRAGGTGLNLTAATHVLHYDRWWNPAVEDQATDRAHRIGQRRTVEVHKLVTAGTVEERIAEIIERKRTLSAHVVGAGEAWISELGDDELAELVALSPDAAIDDLDEEWVPRTDVQEAS